MAGESIPPFESVRRALGLGDPAAYAAADWPATQSAYPGTGPRFLEEAFLRDAMAYAEIPEEPRPLVLAAAAAVRASEPASRLAWHFAEQLYNAQAGQERVPSDIPGLGEHALMFPALPLLAGIPAARELHRARGVPPEIVSATMADIGLWMRRIRARKGRWGLAETHWLVHHVRGSLYRLGRVQFMVGRHWGYVHQFRHATTGEVVLLSRHGMVYMRDGRFDGDNDLHDPEGKWTATLTKASGRVTGHPVQPDGLVRREPMTLEGAEWAEALAPDDPVYDMHIPEGEPLDPDAVAASVARVRPFFAKHFPERPVGRRIVCYAWLLDPIYQTLLPSTSNIVGFQRRWHLSLLWGHDRTAWDRVFGGRPADLAKAPRDTGLRRAILDHYARGGRPLSEGGGIWKDDPA